MPTKSFIVQVCISVCVCVSVCGCLQLRLRISVLKVCVNEYKVIIVCVGVCAPKGEDFYFESKCVHV